MAIANEAARPGGRLAGKIALVTGAASGIGKATAKLFSDEGAICFRTDVHWPDGQDDPVLCLDLDVSSEDDWTNAILRIVGLHGRLDVLVNNAGVSSAESIVELSLAEWNRVIAVNQTGVMLGMREAIPAMRDQGGSIVNISSTWGSKATTKAAAYSATKAAVRHLTKHAALAHAKDKIRVNSVHPGVINTPMVANGKASKGGSTVVAVTPLGRMAEPVEIGYACLFLASDEASFITGAELNVDGGYLAT